METISINGKKLRCLMVDRGISQRKLSAMTGVSHFNVNRWVKTGKPNNLKVQNVESIAKALNVTLDELLSICGEGKRFGLSGITPAETDMLQAFRRLSFLGQSKARLYVDDLTQAEASPSKQS